MVLDWLQYAARLFTVGNAAPDDGNFAALPDTHKNSVTLFSAAALVATAAHDGGFQAG